MKRWMKWTGMSLACAGCAFAGAVGGAMFGMWLTFKTYGGPAERLASRFVREADVMDLVARDGGAKQEGLLVRRELPILQMDTASAVFFKPAKLNPPYVDLVRRALTKLDANPIVQADQGEWAAPAKVARTCVLALPKDADDWSSCEAPVKAAWPQTPQMPQQKAEASARAS